MTALSTEVVRGVDKDSGSLRRSAASDRKGRGWRWRRPAVAPRQCSAGALQTRQEQSASDKGGLCAVENEVLALPSVTGKGKSQDSCWGRDQTTPGRGLPCSGVHGQWMPIEMQANLRSFC